MPSTGTRALTIHRHYRLVREQRRCLTAVPLPELAASLNGWACRCRAPRPPGGRPRCIAPAPHTGPGKVRTSRSRNQGISGLNPSPVLFVKGRVSAGQSQDLACLEMGDLTACIPATARGSGVRVDAEMQRCVGVCRLVAMSRNTGGKARHVQRGIKCDISSGSQSASGCGAWATFITCTMSDTFDVHNFASMTRSCFVICWACDLHGFLAHDGRSSELNECII